MAGAGLLEGGAADDLAVADQGDQEGPVVAVVGGRLADPDDLGLRGAAGGEPAQGVLPPADRDLVRGLLRHRHQLAVVSLAGDQLVDEAARRVAGARDQLGADAVGVDRCGRERGDGVLVEVARHHDPGARGAEGVQLRPDVPRDQAEVAGVEPDRAQAGARDLHRTAYGLGDVVGVDEQGGADAQRLHLGAEGVGLVVVQQREGVCGGPGGRDAVGSARREVAGRVEAGDVRRPRGGHGRLLVRAARPHLDAGSFARGQGHPGGGRGDGGVVVVDRQQDGLEQHRLGERALDDEERRVGEVRLALGVAPDVAGEAVGREPVEHVGIDHAVQGSDRRGVEAERLDGVERTTDAGHDAVPAPLRQPPREELEDRAPVGRARLPGGLHHRQLVVVGEEPCRGMGGTSHDRHCATMGGCQPPVP